MARASSLSASSCPPAASRAVLRWNRPASTAASCRSFCSVADSVSYTFLLKIIDCGLYGWLLSTMCFCTSKNLLARMPLLST